jgi:hypothetical protein
LPSPIHVPSMLSFPPSFKPCVSHFLEALCYSSSGVVPSSGDGVNRK